MQYSFINYNLTLYFTSLIYFITGNKFSSHLPLAITNLFQPPTYSLCLWACFSFFLFTLYDLIFKILHISEIIWYLSFSVWLISLSMIPSKSIHVVAGGKIFLFMAQLIVHCVYILLLLYPFIYTWALRLYPYLDYCK